MEIGSRLRSLRLSRNLTQEELADRCELSKGFISQVENNLTSPSIATLTDLLECLGSSLRQFFGETSPDKVVFRKEDMFEKRDDTQLRGGIVWLVPNAQKNRMEPILLTLGPGGRSEDFPAHGGEEFGYILSGKVELLVGDAKYPVRRGESFCLHPDAPHSIYNPGPTAARLLWASAPPSF